MDTTRKSAIITFVIITALWIFMVMHGTFGFERPNDGHAKFVDLFNDGNMDVVSATSMVLPCCCAITACPASIG